MRYLTWIVTAPLILSGCGKPQPPATTKPNEVAVVPKTLPAVTAEEWQADIKKSGSEFVRALRAGNASSDQLTKEFRASIAPPVLTTDFQRGFSPLKLADRFKEFDKLTDVLTVDCPVGTPTLGYVVTSGSQGKFWIRMLRVENLWLVDYIHFTVNGSAIQGNMPSGESAANGWYTALIFLDSLMTGKLESAQNLLTTAGKTAIAPPVFESDKTQGFSKEKLKDNLPKLIPANSTITELKVTGDTVTGDAVSTGSTRKLTLKLVAGRRPGEMLIDRVEIQ